MSIFLNKKPEIVETHISWYLTSGMLCVDLGEVVHMSISELNDNNSDIVLNSGTAVRGKAADFHTVFNAVVETKNNDVEPPHTDDAFVWQTPARVLIVKSKAFIFDLSEVQAVAPVTFSEVQASETCQIIFDGLTPPLLVSNKDAQLVISALAGMADIGDTLAMVEARIKSEEPE